MAKPFFPKNGKVVIVGAGVAGLTTAHTLIHKGVVKPSRGNLVILERSPILKPVVGAGFALQSGAIVLRKLGFTEKLNQIGHPIDFLRQQVNGGKKIGSTNLREAAIKSGLKIDNNFLIGGVLRADLLNALAEKLPDGVLQLGKEIRSYEEKNDQVYLKLANGEEMTCDLLIGCDGINSSVRNQMLGPQKPTFSQNALWFGVSTMPDQHREFTERSLNQIFGKGSYSGYYPCGNKGEVIFWNVHPSTEVLEESWEVEGAKDKVMEIVKNQNIPDPFPAIVKNATRLMHFGMYYRDPLPSSTKWHKGRVVLTGDACHATLPYLGQGANQAIEDAAFLAMCLSNPSFASLDEALTSYHKIRQKLVRSATMMGKLELASSEPLSTFRDVAFKFLHSSGLFGSSFTKIWKTNAEDALKF